MTTIAYKDGKLAADTGMSVGRSRIGRVVKIARRSDGCLAGAAGHAAYCHAFLRWFSEGSAGEPPKAEVDQETIGRGVIVRPDGTIDVFEPGGSFTVADVPYYAIGAGRPEALGAMFAGGDARTAVAAAIEHDADTFGEITVLSHAGEALGLAAVKEAAE